MEVSESTLNKIGRALTKAASKFPEGAEPLPLTDILIQVKQESGELLIFDDDDNELTRCVVDEWIGNNNDSFYDDALEVIQHYITGHKELAESFNVLRPYTFVLIDEDKETIADLYVVDDDTIVLSGQFLEGLQEDLDAFWEELLLIFGLHVAGVLTERCLALSCPKNGVTLQLFISCAT